jgi:hypothetical protein
VYFHALTLINLAQYSRTLATGFSIHCHKFPVSCLCVVSAIGVLIYNPSAFATNHSERILTSTSASSVFLLLTSANILGIFVTFSFCPVSFIPYFIHYESFYSIISNSDCAGAALGTSFHILVSIQKCYIRLPFYCPLRY